MGEGKYKHYEQFPSVPYIVSTLLNYFLFCTQAESEIFIRKTFDLSKISFLRYAHETAMPVGRLVRQVADKSQKCTQYSWKRPYGVGLLVAGVDRTGPHLFNTCPSGNFYEYKAYAIGLRSQVKYQKT